METALFTKMASESVGLLSGVEEVKEGRNGGIPTIPRRRVRRYKDDEERWIPPPESDWDPDLPYGGKVFLARFKKPDPWWIIALEVLAVVFAIGLAYYSYYHFDHLHYHVTKGYANLGYAVAQHEIGQKLLNGKGVNKNPELAMEWFKMAADQGHPESSYNLAVGHMKGIRKDLLSLGFYAGLTTCTVWLLNPFNPKLAESNKNINEPHKLIAHAASHGIPEAQRTLHEHCNMGRCD